MAGRRIRICPPRDFVFDSLEGGADAQLITLAERIDCSQYDSAELVVRVAGAITMAEASAQIDVLVKSDGFTPDDPSQDYFSTAIISVPFQYSASGYAAGTLELGSTSGDLGSMLAVQVQGTPGSVTGALNGRLAMDLVLKTS